jgi:hypothetical protein
MSQRRGKGNPRAQEARERSPRAPPQLYTLRVSLLTGPVTEGFASANPVVSRTLQLRGDQTLADLHRAIFRAFDREEEHLYEFQLGKGPYDPQGPRYVHPVMREEPPWGDIAPPAGVVTETTLDELGLRVGRRFGYWFDFGDDWWHQVEVVDIAPEAPAARYPRVVERIGASPPQYVDWDEEEQRAAAGEQPKRVSPPSREPTEWSFALNPYEHERFTRCPYCERPTRLRKVPLALRVPRHGLLALALPCRFCPLDSFLIAHQDVLERELRRVLGEPKEVGRYQVLGVVRPEVWCRGRGVKGSLRLADEEAIQPFKETGEMRVTEGSWGPAELH